MFGRLRKARESLIIGLEAQLEKQQDTLCNVRDELHIAKCAARDAEWKVENLIKSLADSRQEKKATIEAFREQLGDWRVYDSAPIWVVRYLGALRTEVVIICAESAHMAARVFSSQWPARTIVYVGSAVDEATMMAILMRGEGRAIGEDEECLVN